MSSSLKNLLAKNEIRIASVGEIIWVRIRILVLFVVVLVGGAYGAWNMACDPVSWLTLAFLISLVISALGMNLSYHSYFCHGAFETRRWLHITLGVLGVATLRGPVIDWVAHHRRHHKYCDRPHLDPHTPLEYGRSGLEILKGLMWVFIGEKLTRIRTVNKTWASDLMDDPDLILLNQLYEVLLVLSFIMPGVVVYVFTRDGHSALIASCVLGCLRGGITYFVIAFFINGLCHLTGKGTFSSFDNSRNLTGLAMLTFGGSLHNNHHAFPRSLAVSLNGEQDPFDVVYTLLERAGLIWNVQRPSSAALEAARILTKASDG